MRRFVGAAAILLVCVGFVAAETFRGFITDASDKEVKVTVFKKKGDEGKKMTFKVSKDTKFFKAKGKKDKEDCTLDDLKKAVEKGKDKGVFATIDAEDGKATAITVRAGGKKGKKKDDK